MNIIHKRVLPFLVTFFAVAGFALSAHAAFAWTITITQSPNGTITSPLPFPPQSGPAVTVNAGANRVFAITPAAHYQISDVSVDGNSAGAVTSYTFTNVQADHTITATFASIPPHTITASAGVGGSINPSGSLSVADGGNQTYAVTANAGYSIAGVLADGVSAGAVANYTFANTIADHTIAASFSVNIYTITASAGANGSINPSGALPVNGASNQTYAITPSAGYRVADVLVDGNSIGAVTSHAFTNVIANHTIAASFAVNPPATHAITVSVGAGGSVAPSGSVIVNDAAAQSFVISVNSGYHIADVLVDGNSVGAVATHDFTNVLADHTIAVSFAADPAPVVSSGGGGGGGGGGGSGILYGSGGGLSAPVIPDQGIAVVATTPAPAAVSKPASVANSVSVFTARNLSRGSHGADVVALQNRLIAEGLMDKDLATGYFGSITLAAVKAYQAKYGVPQTGLVGPLTRASFSQTLAATPGASHAFAQNLSVGTKGEDVNFLQKLLTALGFFTVEPTGYFGSQTAAAVKAFQAAHQVPQTGFVGPMTRSHLNQ